MNILPINRDNDTWTKINSQFLKGGFDWYNQRIPDLRRWYYNYYLIDGSEKYCCSKVAWNRRRSKVTCWLRNIEKFEKTKKQYEKEDRENKQNKQKKEKQKEEKQKEDKRKEYKKENEEKEDEENWERRNREWRKENSMSWRRTKYEQ